jgi:hypothetical protein
MRKERRTRILRRLVLGLAVAAFVAPAAQARVDEPGTGTQESTAVGQPSGDTAGIPGQDDKMIVPWNGGASTAGIPGHDDKMIVPWNGGASTAGIPGHDDKMIVPAPVETVRSPSTFDWGDAFVGAGGALALMLLAGGLALGVRHRPRPAAA